MFCFKNVIVSTVHEKVQHVRTYSFSAFFFQQINDIVVGGRQIFNQNLADDTDFWFFYIITKFDGIEIFNDSTDVFVEFRTFRMFYRFDTDLFPFFMEGIDRTRHFFVRAGFVNNTHKQIAIYQSLNGTIEEAVVNLESRILLYTGAQ